MNRDPAGAAAGGTALAPVIDAVGGETETSATGVDAGAAGTAGCLAGGGSSGAPTVSTLPVRVINPAACHVRRHRVTRWRDQPQRSASTALFAGAQPRG
jgi:hypothetical protein